jgi:hypothetical protein
MGDLSNLGREGQPEEAANLGIRSQTRRSSLQGPPHTARAWVVPPGSRRGSSSRALFKRSLHCLPPLVCDSELRTLETCGLPDSAQRAILILFRIINYYLAL